MKVKALLLVLPTALGAVLSGHAAAADVYVIANGSLSVSPAELREVFLGERQFAGKQRLVPTDNASLQRDFVPRVVGIEPSKYGAVWAKKGFREGLNPPELLATDQDVIAVVKATPGAIGYVSRMVQGVYLIEKY